MKNLKINDKGYIQIYFENEWYELQKTNIEEVDKEFNKLITREDKINYILSNVKQNSINK